MPTIALVLISTLLGLGLAEVALRKFSPISVPKWELHPKYLYRYRPSLKRIYRHPRQDGGKWVVVETNAKGWRDQRLDFNPAAYKIVLYGDSFAAGEYSSSEDTLAGQLERKLGGNVQVINLGIDGYGPDQVLLRMRDELPELKPDLAIVTLFSGNDFGDLMRNKIFRLDPQGVLKESKPTVSDQIRADFVAAKNLPSLHLVRLGTQVWSRVKAKLISSPKTEAPGTPYVERMIQIRLNETRESKEGNLIVTNLYADDVDFDLSVNQDPELGSYKIKTMEGVTRLIQEETRKNGVKLLFVIVPGPVDACAGYPIQVDTKKFPSYSRNKLSEIGSQVLRRVGIPFVNMFDRLENPDCSKFWYKDFGNIHWNERGQGQAVEALIPLIHEIRNGS